MPKPQDCCWDGLPDTQSPYLLRVMNCRVNAYNVGLTFWQREKESLEKKREGRQGRERSCGNKDRKRIYQTDTYQDRYRESLHGPQDFHAQFLTTNSIFGPGYRTGSSLCSLFELTTQNTKVSQPQITESFMCWILQPGPFRRSLTLKFSIFFLKRVFSAEPAQPH